MEGDVVAGRRGGDANAFPVERGGDLQGNARERSCAVVADGEQGADGDLLIGGEKMDVDVEGGEGDGLALGVIGGGRGWSSGCGLRDGWAGWVVVWPFSSVEREKMTCRGGAGSGWAAGCGRAETVLARRQSRHWPQRAEWPRHCKRCGRRRSFMSPGLSVFLVWTRCGCGATTLDAREQRCGAGEMLRRGRPRRRWRH